ncbi:MAG: 6-bladed beta-propeller [Cyclobacteriaceae bacterium]
MNAPSQNKRNNRRDFLIKAGLLVGGLHYGQIAPAFNIIHKKRLPDEIIGHGEFRYKVDKHWCQASAATTPVTNCHEMVEDRQGRLILLTDHPKNNIIIFDKSGKVLSSWTLNLKMGHGLTIHDENGEEFLYITDGSAGEVYKTTLDGKVVLQLPRPDQLEIYAECDKYRPTETAIGPNGDIYVADGYGSQYILRFDNKGNYLSKFGGSSFQDKKRFKEAHGIALDNRDKQNPTLLITARIKNTFKRFTLDGAHLEDIYLPGAYISRPVIQGDTLYSGVCFGMTRHDFNLQNNLGFVTILNKEGRVVSNPGGTRPKYKDGHLMPLFQDQPIFKHCHDVCVDRDENLYVCQWKADGAYPYKLHRV